MRETGFIKQNKEKWDKFEKVLKSKKRDPDELSELFIEVTDDLSYSRTFYPNRSVRVYLNNIAQQIFHSIYKNKASKRSYFLNFWREELPYCIYKARKEFLISFIVFAVAFIIGIVSSAHDPEFPRQILGDRYIEMTQENIANGDPMAVYKKAGAADMALRITWNNILVAFNTFIFGLLASIGSIVILLNNGIMVGAFQYYFYEQGLLQESALTIWMHGTLEISAIIIAGAAGLRLGSGLIFPGTYSRLQAFMLSARQGIKIMLGLIPVFIMAGFIEGFITRYTEAPDALRLVAILTSLTFILGYFVFLPWLRSRQGFETPDDEDQLPPTQFRNVTFHEVKSFGELFTDVFQLYKELVKPLIFISIALGLLYCGSLFLLIEETSLREIQYSDWFFLQIHQFFNYSGQWQFALLNWLAMTIGTLFPLYFLIEKSKGTDLKKINRFSGFGGFSLKQGWKIALFMAVLHALFYLPFGWAILCFFILAPLLFFGQYISVVEHTNPFAAIGRIFSLLGNNWGRLFGTFLTLSLLVAIYFFVIDSPFGYFLVKLISMLFPFDEPMQRLLVIGFMAFVNMGTIVLVFPMYYVGLGHHYYHAKEINEANTLSKQIERIGIRKKAYGLETLE